MSITDDEQEYNTRTIKENCGVALFSKELIALCLKKLLAFINEFKIKELPDEEKINSLIDELNNRNRKKFQKADLTRFYKELVKHGSFKEAAIALNYSRATLYRYKEKFKKIGITENNVQPNNDISIPTATLDFAEYHAYLFNSNLIRGIK